MELTSQAFKNGEEIPEKYTCDGKNLSPPLSISDAPVGIKSFVILMHDPDMPVDIQQKMGISEWNHWIVFNIKPETLDIPEGGENNLGTYGNNTNGRPAYEGPCPSDKQHRYFFRIYALDTTLNLQEGSNRKDVEDAMKGHIKAKAELRGVYDRQNKSNNKI